MSQSLVLKVEESQKYRLSGYHHRSVGYGQDMHQKPDESAMGSCKLRIPVYTEYGVRSMKRHGYLGRYRRLIGQVEA